MIESGTIHFHEEGEIATLPTKKVPCPLECGLRMVCPKLVITLAGTTYDLYICEECGSYFYDPFPVLDYKDYESELGVRHYVEVGAGIESIASYLLPALEESSGGSLLDVGCGFGFSLDLARRLRGWDTWGVEPGLQADLGATHLGLSIERCMLKDSKQLKGRSFDIIFSSEVLEHLDNPFDFVQSLKERLSPGGILVLTTPNAEAVRVEIPYHELIPILSPGGHMILFTEGSLRMVLRKQGFSHVEIKQLGTTLVAYAGLQPFRLETPNIPHEMERYYASYLSEKMNCDWLRWGMVYRAIRDNVNHGKYEFAMKIADTLEDLPFDEKEEIKTVEEFEKKFPFCYPCLLYYLAMLQLHDSQTCLEKTAHLFNQAFRMLRLKLELFPNSSPEESTLLWKAKAREGVAWARARNRDAAKEVLRFMNDWTKGGDESDLPTVPAKELRFLTKAIRTNSLCNWILKPLGGFFSRRL